MTLASLDTLISRKSLLLHPFYKRWSKGELTMDELRIYAKEYFHLVRAVPGIVSRVLEHATDPLLRFQIEQNIAEETEHIALWERFAKSLGISEHELADYEPSLMVREAVSHLGALAGKSLEDGIVTMYALERELPKIAETKKAGLSAYYNLTSDDAHVYFDEHLGEEKHLDVWRSVSLASTDTTDTAMQSMQAQNAVLDGVCERCGMVMSC